MFSCCNESDESALPVYADLSQQRVSFEQIATPFDECMDTDATNAQCAYNAEDIEPNEKEEMLLHLEHGLESEIAQSEDVPTEDVLEETSNTDTSSCSYGSQPPDVNDEHQPSVFSGTSGTKLKTKQSLLRRGRRYTNGLCPPVPAVIDATSWIDPPDIAEYFPKTAHYKIPAGVRSSMHFLSPQRWVKEKNFHAYKFSVWSEMLKSGKFTEAKDQQRIAQILRQLTWLLQNSWNGEDKSKAPPEMLWRARREETRLLERLLQQKLASMKVAKRNFVRSRICGADREPKRTHESDTSQRSQPKHSELRHVSSLSANNGRLFKLLILERQWTVVLSKLPSRGENGVGTIRDLIEDYVRELTSAADEIAEDQFTAHDLDGPIEDLVDEGYALQKKLEAAAFAELCSGWFLFKRNPSRAISKVVKKVGRTESSHDVTSAHLNSPLNAKSATSNTSAMKTALPPIAVGDKTPSLPPDSSATVASVLAVSPINKTPLSHDICGITPPLSSAAGEAVTSVRSRSKKDEIIQKGTPRISPDTPKDRMLIPPIVSVNNTPMLSSMPEDSAPTLLSNSPKNTTTFSSGTPHSQTLMPSRIHRVDFSLSLQETKGGKRSASKFIVRANEIAKVVEESTESQNAAVSGNTEITNANTAVVTYKTLQSSVGGARKRGGTPKNLVVKSQEKDATISPGRKKNRNESQGCCGQPRERTQKDIVPLPSLLSGSSEVEDDIEFADAEQRFSLDEISEIENRWLSFCLEDERANDEKFSSSIKSLLNWCTSYRNVLKTPMPKSVAAARHANTKAKIEKYLNALEGLLNQPEGSHVNIYSTTSESSGGVGTALGSSGKKQEPVNGSSLGETPVQ